MCSNRGGAANGRPADVHGCEPPQRGAACSAIAAASSAVTAAHASESIPAAVLLEAVQCIAVRRKLRCGAPQEIGAAAVDASSGRIHAGTWSGTKHPAWNARDVVCLRSSLRVCQLAGSIVPSSCSTHAGPNIPTVRPQTAQEGRPASRSRRANSDAMVCTARG